MKSLNVDLKRGISLAFVNFSKGISIAFVLLIIAACSQQPEYESQTVHVPGFETLNYKLSKNFSTIEINHEDHPTLQIDIDEYKGKGIRSSKIIKQTQFIKLETNEENLIGAISRLFFHNDTIIVKDSNISKGVFQFNSDGSFIRKIGSNGQGPGEFLSPDNFTFSTDSYFIHSEFQGKIFEFDHSGKYKNEHEIPFLFDDFITLRNRFLFNTYNRVNGHIEPISNYMLVTTDSEYEISDAGFYFDPNFYLKLRAGFENSLKTSGDKAYYIQPFTPSIYSISDNLNKIEVLFEFDFGEKGISQKQLYEILKKNPVDIRGQLMDQGFVIIEDFEANHEKILLTILYNRIPLKLIIDVASQNVTGFTVIIDDQYRLGGYSPNFLIENKLVSVLEANSVLKVLQKVRNENIEEYENIISTFPELKTIKVDDNFILRIDELK